MSQLNNYLPEHARNYTNKRFLNSSTEEVRNALMRQRQLKVVQGMQKKLIKDFKDETEKVHTEVLEKSKDN